MDVARIFKARAILVLRLRTANLLLEATLTGICVLYVNGKMTSLFRRLIVLEIAGQAIKR